MLDRKLTELLTRIGTMRKEVPTKQSLLVGISGIDSSGKGFITSKFAASAPVDLNVAVIHADDWLNLPCIRFGGTDPGPHFYNHALRLDEMFERLILPLKHNRSIHLITDLAKETAQQYHQHEYCFDKIDVILLEGIFLFKQRYIQNFDLKIWIDCSFETALQRAVIRSQEGLSARETVRKYNNIYFPAQRLHFMLDDPRGSADELFDNDQPFL